MLRCFSSSAVWRQNHSFVEIRSFDFKIQTDPFQSVSSLSKEEKMEANNQTVPSFFELLLMAKKHNISLIFDLKNEKNSTGFHNSDSYYATETIKESGISPEKVILSYAMGPTSFNVIFFFYFSEISNYAYFSYFSFWMSES